MKKIILTTTLLTLTTILMFSCGAINVGGGSDTHNQGREGYDCYSNKTCNENLICNENNKCVRSNSTDNTGKEGYNCYPNNTCDSGLICNNNKCIKENNNNNHIGEEGYSCYNDYTCNYGLVCNNNNICKPESNEFNIYSLNSELFVNKTTISNNNCRWDSTDFFGKYRTVDELVRLFSEMNIFNHPTSDTTLEMKVCYDSYCTTGGTILDLVASNSNDSKVVLLLTASNSEDMRDPNITPDEEPFDCQLQEEIEYKFTYSSKTSGKLDIHYTLTHPSGTECYKLKFPEDCDVNGYSAIDDSHKNIQEYGKGCYQDDDCTENLICGSDDTCTDEDGYKKKSKTIRITPLTMK